MGQLSDIAGHLLDGVSAEVDKAIAIAKALDESAETAIEGTTDAAFAAVEAEKAVLLDALKKAIAAAGTVTP